MLIETFNDSLNAFRFMKRILPILSCLLIAAAPSAIAQGNDYKIGSGTTQNSGTSLPSPLNDYYMGDRTQQLYLASELVAEGMGPGFIYAVKWDIKSISSKATIYDWRMYIGTTSVSSLTGWVSGISTLVYNAGTNNPYNPGAGVHTYKLPTPFYWNGIDNIIIETCHGNSGRPANTYTENAVINNTATKHVSYYYFHNDNNGSYCGYTGSQTGTYNSRSNVIFTWGPAGYNNTGVTALTKPSGKFCPGTYNAEVQIKNFGQNQVTGVKIYWELDGVLQPVINYPGSLDTFNGSGSTSDVVQLGSIIFGNTDRVIKAYTSMPNNVADTVNSDDTLKLVIGASPKVKITPEGPTVFCTAGNVNVTLNAPTGAGSFYQWYKDGQSITGATSSAYTAKLAGDYTVRIDSNGCTNISPVMRVDNLAMPLPLVHPSGYPVLCSGDSVTLVANAGVTGASYQWQYQGADIAGATNASYTIQSPGNYTVITSKAVCNATSAGINVVPAEQPAPLIERNEATGRLSTLPIFVSYQWRVDGNDIPGATLFAHMPTQNGDYTVEVSNGGCSAESPAITVGNVNINNVYNNKNIKIYPNPADDHLYVDAPAGSDINICGIDGKVLIRQQVSKEAINISTLSNGIYIIKVTDENGQLLTLDKLVKSDR